MDNIYALENRIGTEGYKKLQGIRQACRDKERAHERALDNEMRKAEDQRRQKHG